MASHHDVKPIGTDGPAAVVTADVASRTDSDTEKHDIETTDDGRFHQYIERDGKQVLISWTKAEEARVVRKADFILLPLFTVCNII